MYRVTAAVAALLLSSTLQAYSVLTHEAIIDSAWASDIRPLLVKRFPAATRDELLEAHAHVYAGAIIQDMGYSPFGSKFFSDLTHYVMSGDFIMNLIRESQTLNEFAFALGALAHYAADTDGHSIAVNPSVAIEYPKLARKYGKSVTYADNKTSHMRVEFSFDVLQVARGNYAPQAYHDFIGFEVSKELMERAFRDTYSLEMSEIFGDEDMAIGTYRYAVSNVIPDLTRAAWKLNKKDLQKSGAPVPRKRFVYNISRASYRKRWGTRYKSPGIGVRILTFLLRILPKIGPLKVLSFKPPTPQTDLLFQNSFNRTLDDYRHLLADLDAGRLSLPNRDFDTGRPTRPGEYRLADDTYAELARELADRDPATVDPRVREHVLNFYSDLSLSFATRRDPKQWTKTVKAVEKLRSSNKPVAY